MTQASESRRARKAAEKNVIQIPTKKSLLLSEDECLRMENYTLKLQIIQEAAEKQAAPVLLQRAALGDKIGKRLGVDLGAYSIKLDTRELVPLNKPTETVEQAANPSP